MKNRYVSLAAITCAAGATLAAPRESVTFTAVPSNGLQSEIATNAVRTVEFTGSDAGGAYTARYLTVTGQITDGAQGSYASEAAVMITPPGGATPFFVNPFNFGAFPVGAPTQAIPAGRFGVPVSAFAAPGTWTFTFFELFNDGAVAVDATWDTITFTLDDAPPPAPTAVTGPLSTTFANVTVNGLAAAPAFNTVFSAPAGTTVAGYRVSLQATAVNANPAANMAVNTTPLTNLRVRVTPPGGVAVTGVFFGNFANSSANSELLLALPAARDSGGDWAIAAFSTVDNPGVDSVLNTLNFQLLPLQAPANTDLGTLAVNVQKDGSASLTAGQTKWFKFNLPVALTAGENRALEIDTEGSPVGDTSIGLYNSNGARVNADFNDGSGLLANLSFGSDNHPAPGDGLAFNGRDGAALAVGDYYLAVTAGDAGIGYQPGLYGVTNTSTVVGDVQVHLRLLEPGALPPASVDAGVIGGPSVITATVHLDDPAQVKWVKFTTLADVTFDVANYLDIDTEGTLLTGTGTAPNDTHIGLYRSTGVAVAADDDDGSAALSQLTFGGAAAPRPAPGDGLAYNGRDATAAVALPAGTYYLALGAYNNAFNPGFNVVHTASGFTTGANGDILANFHTNLPAAPTLCSTADIGVQGGFPGHDHLLDNNDFIVYIADFFGQAASADIGIQGGFPGSDGLWDNNDFIVFIAIFFTDQAGCNG